MRILATADLHFNHPRSRRLAAELIEKINQMTFDVLLVIGDTATAEDGELERCLSLFTFRGPKLLVAGNHELWTRRGDSYGLFTEELPRRVRAVGWHWLEGDPVDIGGIGLVGTIGWYDYSFAPEHLEVPRRFYHAKVSPGAAERLSEHEHLLADRSDVRQEHLEIVARWNDGRHVHLHRSDEQFLQERLAELQRGIKQLSHARHIIAAVHHLPFRQMLPPRRNPSWDFAWAYLGSEAIGQTLLRHQNIGHILCGHSHMPFESTIGTARVINIGSGYREKRLVELEIA